MTPKSFFDKLCKTKPSGIMVTVLATDGQGPARVGNRLFWSEGTRIAGTVGGGSNEQQVLEACARLSDSRAELEINAPFPGALPSCGGTLRVRLEKVDFGNPEEAAFWKKEEERSLNRRKKLYLMGAGHVAREVSWLADRNDFQVNVVDPRRELLTEELFPPGCRLHLQEHTSFLSENLFAPDDFLIIAGPDHAGDLAALEEAASTSAGYIGVMGSRKKIHSFEKVLREKGVWQSLEGRLHAPVGIPLPSKTPAEVAISIVAELIEIRAKSAKKQ